MLTVLKSENTSAGEQSKKMKEILEKQTRVVARGLEVVENIEKLREEEKRRVLSSLMRSGLFLLVPVMILNVARFRLARTVMSLGVGRKGSWIGELRCCRLRDFIAMRSLKRPSNNTFLHLAPWRVCTWTSALANLHWSILRIE